jgi:hypothetical protein
VIRWGGTGVVAHEFVTNLTVVHVRGSAMASLGIHAMLCARCRAVSDATSNSRCCVHINIYIVSIYHNVSVDVAGVNGPGSRGRGLHVGSCLHAGDDGP